MNRDRMFICHIRDEIEFLSDATVSLTYEKLDNDKAIQHIVQKSLEIIGEASKNVSPEMKAEYPEIHWSVIGKMRDRLTHGYFDVSWDIVWNVLNDDIPSLKSGISAIITDKEW